jgi:hypothetical protein
MSSPKRKNTKKLSPVQQEMRTVEHWKQFIIDMGFYDVKYECKLGVDREKNFIKEYNLTSYFLEAFDMMGSVRDQAFTEDSFIICLIEINV